MFLETCRVLQRVVVGNSRQPGGGSGRDDDTVISRAVLSQHRYVVTSGTSWSKGTEKPRQLQE